jgi:hypothetical protein
MRVMINIAVIFSLTVCIFIIFLTESVEVKKDCSIAETSPDFTTKEKEQCRRIRTKS